jgi:hypothetical protein
MMNIVIIAAKLVQMVVDTGGICGTGGAGDTCGTCGTCGT